MNDLHEQDTQRPPADDDTVSLLRELRAALERTSELCVKVSGKLTKLEIAQLTAEHRLNVHRDRFDALDTKLAELVLLLPQPQPPNEAA